MAILCADLKLLFVMVPGTACSVVGKALKEQCAGRFLPERDLMFDDGRVHEHKHNTVDEILHDGVMEQTSLDEYLVVATVRNPYDRIATYYQRLAGEWPQYSLDVQRRQIEREKEKMAESEYQRRLQHHENMSRRLVRRQKVMRHVGFNWWASGTAIRWLIRDAIRPPVMRVDRRGILFPMLGGVDVAIRHDKLEQGLNHLLSLRGLKHYVALERKNVTPDKKQYQQYYSHISHAIIRFLYGGPLRHFEFSLQGTQSEDSLIWLNPDKKSRFASSASD